MLVGVGLQVLDVRLHLHWFGWRPRLDFFRYALLYIGIYPLTM